MATPLSDTLPRRAPPAPVRARAQILSVVCALTGHEARLRTSLEELHEAIVKLSVLSELVVVLNGPNPESASILRALTTRCDHLQVYVTRRRVDYSTALMVGLENAIGDWVATIDAESDDPSVIRRLFEEALRQQADVALSVPDIGKRSVLDALTSRVFHGIFRALHGFSLALDAPTARLLSRTVVNSVLCDESPLIAFETLSARMSYRRCIIRSTRRNPVPRSPRERAHIRWRIFIGVAATPLRLANLLSGISAAGGLVYSLCVMIVYFVKKDVVPGWTTLSLMQSCMFAMLAIVLWLLSEYMLLLLDPGARRPRYEIADEFGGHAIAPGDLLNVETEV
jgi:hypothetical protein